MDKKEQKRSKSIIRKRDYPGAITGEISSSSSSSDVKCCEICRTTKTPLWRGGPSGPKSVCNACGIRYRKRRRELPGFNNRRVERTNEDNNSVTRLVGFATDLLLRQRSILKLRRRRQLAEEEEAAVLLMAISSGFLYMPKTTN